MTDGDSQAGTGPETSFPTMNINEVGQALARLHEQVTRGHGRVEIADPDGGSETAVIISKSELQGLERALEILSDTDGVRNLCQSLARLCGQVEQSDGSMAASAPALAGQS